MTNSHRHHLDAIHATVHGRHISPQFARWRAAGFDFVELLVPEPGELDLAAHPARARRRGPRRRAGGARQPRPQPVLRRRRAAQGRARLPALLRRGRPMHWAPGWWAGRCTATRWCSPPARRIRSTRALRQRRQAWCVEGLREAAPIAAAAGVRLGVEPLNRFETDILNTTRQGVALMELVDHDAVGLVLDTFHMNMEDDDIAGAIRAAGRHLIHFQANENHRGHLGSGHIDWTGSFAPWATSTIAAGSRSSPSVAPTSASAFRSRNGSRRRTTNRPTWRRPARSCATCCTSTEPAHEHNVAWSGSAAAAMPNRCCCRN